MSATKTIGAYLHNYEWVCGDTFEQSIAMTDNGSVVDITGWTFFLTIKQKYTDADGAAAASQTVTSHVNAVAGLTKFTISASTMAALSGNYVYDMQFKKADGTVRTFMRGDFIVLKQATQRTS